MKNVWLISMMILVWGSTLKAQSKNNIQPIKVYLLGTFHFAQTDDSYDVLSSKHQKSIQELCDIIAQQKPDKVFVERQPEFEFKNKLNDLYNEYVEGKQLKSQNEIYQVGFRVAKQLKHTQVYQCDNPGRYGKYFRASKNYAEQHGQMTILEGTAPTAAMRYDDTVDEDSLMQAISFLDYIKWINSDLVMETSHADYITNFPQIGSTDYYNYDDDDTLIGAELTADWYRRNIMIYSKMINQVDYTEKAIFLLIGGDHVPIIQRLFEANPYFKVVAASDWLK